MDNNLRKITCVGCGFQKEFVVNNMVDYERNGFSFVYDASNGLTTRPLCMECRAKADEHVKALEDMTHIEFGCMHFPNHDKNRHQVNDQSQAKTSYIYDEVLYKDLIYFFAKEGISWHNDTDFENSLYFWSYGNKFNVRNEESKFVFRCQQYETIEALIRAIDMECRGGDGKF